MSLSSLTNLPHDTLVEGALAIVILLLLWVGMRLGRIARLLAAREARTRAVVPEEHQGRYMREDTLAEFLQNREKNGR